MALNVGGSLTSDSGLKTLNKYLESRSYVEAYSPSQGDVALFEGFGGKGPDGQKYPHAKRWYSQIGSYSGDERKKFPGVKKALSDFGVAANGASAASAPAAGGDDDDDFELFGSDDDEAAEKAREDRVKAYQEKKAKKPALIAKSNVILDVKPWDDETDMKQMEDAVRAIGMEGLKWGASKLVPMAYGIKKLQIVCVVEDDKVSIDELTEKIQDLEDIVQSVDIAAFQKI
jgi:elongation factor 1-beta